MAMNPRLLRPRASQQAAPCTYPASLLLHFDGNFTDSSVNGLTVTANGGAAISTAEKKFGSGSAYFTGSSSDYATTPSTDGMVFGGDFTIEAWTYWTGDGTESFVPIASCTGASDATGWLITSIGGAMHFLGSGGSGWDVVAYATGVMIPQNQWSHIAVVRSGSSVTLYIDGTAVASATSSIAIVAGDDFYLGHYPIYDGSTPVSFTGYIDGFRITKAALYCDEFTPPTTPPTPTVVPPCGC